MLLTRKEGYISVEKDPPTRWNNLFKKKKKPTKKAKPKKNIRTYLIKKN